MRIAKWSTTPTKAEARALQKMHKAEDNVLDVLCMNVEGFSSDRVYKFARDFVISHYTLIIVDEATSIKNPKAKRTKALFQLGMIADYRRIATGTPITQSPLDLWGMCTFLKAGCLGHSTFTSFRASYAVTINMQMGSRTFPKIVGYRDLKKLTERISAFSSRLTKDECLDLPDKVYEIHHVEMTPEQVHAYTKLRDEALVQLTEESMVTSTMGMTTVEKLHQICCGHIKDDDGVIHDIPNNRINDLLSLIDNIGKQVVIWCCYQRDVENVMRALTEYGKPQGHFPMSYYGKTSEEGRLESLSQFRSNDNCRWLVGTPGTGGKGITLVNATYMIYYSCGYKLEARLQSEDRIHRIGQTSKCTYIDMACPNTVDLKVIKALRAKKNIADEVLDLHRLRDLLAD